jgi:hypothetical protein
MPVFRWIAAAARRMTTLLFKQRDSGSNRELGPGGHPSPIKHAISVEESGTGPVLRVHIPDPFGAGDPGPGRGEWPAQHTAPHCTALQTT